MISKDLELYFKINVHPQSAMINVCTKLENTRPNGSKLLNTKWFCLISSDVEFCHTNLGNNMIHVDL